MTIRPPDPDESALSFEEICIAMREQHREEVAAIRRPWTFGPAPRDCIRFCFDEEEA